MSPERGQLGPKKRVPLQHAEEVAQYVQERLEPFSDFIGVVGAIHRKDPQVGKVEFVVLPKDSSQFLSILAESGFSGSSRKQTGAVEELKTEIYLARKPEEVNTLILARARKKPRKKVHKATRGRQRAQMGSAAPNNEPDGFRWGASW